MNNDITAQQIAQNYRAMGHSVTLINGIVAGTQMSDATEAERQDCLDRNAGHLSAMLEKDYWTTEDMTAVEAAVAAAG
jgi:glycine cleavage system protein P-like pyridoxal-binding family